MSPTLIVSMGMRLLIPAVSRLGGPGSGLEAAVPGRFFDRGWQQV